MGLDVDEAMLAADMVADLQQQASSDASIVVNLLQIDPCSSSGVPDLHSLFGTAPLYKALVSMGAGSSGSVGDYFRSERWGAAVFDHRTAEGPTIREVYASKGVPAAWASCNWVFDIPDIVTDINWVFDNSETYSESAVCNGLQTSKIKHPDGDGEYVDVVILPDISTAEIIAEALKLAERTELAPAIRACFWSTPTRDPGFVLTKEPVPELSLLDDEDEEELMPFPTPSESLLMRVRIINIVKRRSIRPWNDEAHHVTETQQAIASVRLSLIWELLVFDRLNY
jgi:hypothetical protein